MTQQSPISNDLLSQGSGIPDKLYFRIGEVAHMCEVPTYVLRFWETEFPQLKPNKGGSGQRLFRRRDVEMALRIKALLYDEGYTIPGARQLLKGEQRHKDPQLPLLASDPQGAPTRQLRQLRRDLKDLLSLISRSPSAEASEPALRRRPWNGSENQMDNLFDSSRAHDERDLDERDPRDQSQRDPG